MASAPRSVRAASAGATSWVVLCLCSWGSRHFDVFELRELKHGVPLHLYFCWAGALCRFEYFSCTDHLFGVRLYFRPGAENIRVGPSRNGHAFLKCRRDCIPPALEDRVSKSEWPQSAAASLWRVKRARMRGAIIHAIGSAKSKLAMTTA